MSQKHVACDKDELKGIPIFICGNTSCKLITKEMLS